MREAKCSLLVLFVFFVFFTAGFIKFLECYYLILVTKRRQVGTLCGHAIYTVGESRLIAVPDRSVQTDIAISHDEIRLSFLPSVVDCNFFDV